ncbi:MAG: bacteriocin family protein [Phycisphaerae bacterium]|nr:bacteriocin family protein [Phycisphaerae bacterium]
MPSILRREFAPISDEAWTELDAQAAGILRRMLTARKIVDFSGPHGWQFAAANAGRLNLAKRKSGGVGWGVREVQPVVEMRLPISLQQMELDNLTRGAGDADVDALEQAAGEAARFEDDAVFNGFNQGNISGIRKASTHKAMTLPAKAEDYPKTVADAVKTLTLAGIEGPYALVLSPDAYFTLTGSAGRGYPPRKAVQDVLGGDVLMTPVLTGGVVVSTRGGDYELAVGKDFSLGYAGHDSDAVELFLTESFTFRVLEPAAAVVLNKRSSR